jgi:hypothetical protein
VKPPVRTRPCEARRCLLAAALVLAALAGCRAAAVETRGSAPARGPDIHELVHRQVLTSREVDECVEHWGKGAAGWFEVDFDIEPSGQLVPVEAHGGDADLNACLFEALREIRVPPGSVTERQRASISLR